MKRLFDLSVSVLALIVLLPLFLVIAVLIKLNDGGPVFFKQVRVGKNRAPFVLYKFRSMSVLREASSGEFEVGNLSRVTSIGKFLRRSKLDELPQILNVIKGDMSIVGPRPEVRKWVEIYPVRWMKVLSLSPGITDNASIEFMQEEILLANSYDPEKLYKELILPRKLDYYEEYVDHHSFLGDLKIIALTFIKLFKKQ